MRRTAAFVAASVSGASSAMWAASSFTRPRRAAAGRTSSTSPIAFASTALTRRAVSTISRARTGPTVAASRPRLKGAAKLPRVRATGAPKRVLGHDPQIARERHEHAAADGVAADHGDRRLGHAGDATEPARDARLVAERVLLRLEAQELADVGAADERLVPGPGEDHHADGRIRIELLAEVVPRLVHPEGHGVARLGPVEGSRHPE